MFSHVFSLLPQVNYLALALIINASHIAALCALRMLFALARFETRDNNNNKTSPPHYLLLFWSRQRLRKSSKFCWMTVVEVES